MQISQNNPNCSQQTAASESFAPAIIGMRLAAVGMGKEMVIRKLGKYLVIQIVLQKTAKAI